MLECLPLLITLILFKITLTQTIRILYQQLPLGSNHLLLFLKHSSFVIYPCMYVALNSMFSFVFLWDLEEFWYLHSDHNSYNKLHWNHIKKKFSISINYIKVKLKQTITCHSDWDIYSLGFITRYWTTPVNSIIMGTCIQ